MTENQPRSIRFDSRVGARLRDFVSAHPGLTGSSAANRLVDEGLRMEDHPGVIFRDGPTGRRAVLIGGPDVWEVVAAVRSARSAEPGLSPAEIEQLVSDNTGVPVQHIRRALDYWAHFPQEIDNRIAASEAAEIEEFTAWERTNELLAP